MALNRIYYIFMKPSKTPYNLGMISLLCLLMTSCTWGVDEYLRELKSPNEVIKKNAIYNLGLAKEVKAVPHLIGFLDEGSKDIRIASIEALGRIGDKQAVPQLIRLADEKEIDIRRKAIESLGKIGDPRAMPILLRLLREESSELGTEEKITILWALGVIGDEKSVPVVIEFLNSEDKYIRYSARQSLKKFGG